LKQTDKARILDKISVKTIFHFSENRIGINNMEAQITAANQK